MHYKLIFHALGSLLMLLALTMLSPLAWAMKDHSLDIQAFFMAIVITVIAGGILRLFKPDGKFGRREGFFIVGVGWILVVAFGALPLYLSGVVPSYADAYFEIMSGFTTTGATVILNVEGLSRAMLFWRSLTHWLGGMGIIVLSVAVFSFFSEGGSLFQAEVPGVVPEKILPRLKDTAAVMWGIYIVLSVIIFITLRLAGMTFFEGLIHSFGTISTGGFSSHNISVEAFDNLAIEMLIICFMILASLNFSLYYRMFQKKSLSVFFNNYETKAFLLILTGATGFIAISLNVSMDLPWFQALRQAAFQVVSVCTTTGFSSTDFANWPSVTQGILIILMFVGGCAGSTAGGLKVARLVLLFKYIQKQVLRMAKPRLMIQSKLGKIVISDGIVHEILAFFFIYIVLFVAGALVIMATDVDLVTAFSASAATVGNIGPGLAKVGPSNNYGWMHPVAKWTMSFLMLIGRLEIMTILVLFSPGFWRK